MKNIGGLRLGLTYAGCFLGAGYVSGQELWQFFGSYGLKGFFGLALTMAVLFAFGVLIIRLANKTETFEMDKLIVRRNIPVLRAVVGIMAVFFMYGVYVIMAAGAGALVNRVTGLPAVWGSLMFCTAAAFMTFKGIKGMVNVFSWFVPVLAAGAVVISIISAVKSGMGGISLFESSDKNALLGNWFFSSLTYVSYNIFGTIGIIAPLAARVKKESAACGAALGCGFLSAIAVSIIMAVFASPQSAQAELPMAELAYGLSTAVGIIYCVLMLFGMFGTSLSSFVAVMEFGGQKSGFLLKHKGAFIIALSVAAWALSLFGFGDLIGVVYPVSGYLGFAVMLGVILHAVAVFRKSE